MSHHPSRRRERALAWATAGLTLAGAFLAPPAFAGLTSGSLPNGAALGVSVDAPLTGDTFLAPAGQSTIDVALRGTASVATGVPNATWIYVIDVSGSTAADCAAGTILDCEKTAVVGLNDLLVTAGSALEAGKAIFAGTGAALDSSSAPGFRGW